MSIKSEVFGVKRTKAIVLFVVGSLSLMAIVVGCNSFMICGYQDDPMEWDSAIYHGCIYDGKFWNGYLWEGDWVSCKFPTNTLYSVTIEQNYLCSLASVLTFVLWMPQRVIWKANNDARNLQGVRK